MQLFGLGASHDFATAIAQTLGIALSAHEEREFDGGEHKARPLVSVRGADVYIVHGLYGEPDQSCNDKLCRLLFFAATMADHGAARVTAVVPYLAYGRKDRRTQPRDPVTTRYIAQLFEAVGIDRIVTLEAHNLAAFENAFRCQTVHLDTRPLFAPIAKALAADGPLVVASPDPGGIKRAQLFREYLETVTGSAVDAAFMDKRRARGVVSGQRLVGEVARRSVLILDDLIGSGTTMARAAAACHAAGANAVYALAAHGLFSDEASQVLADPALTRTFVTDSVAPFRLASDLVPTRIATVSAAPLFARALQRLHDGGSISALFQP
ncbi:ribose-phosphate diphosphokinase [Salinisphaera sp. SPP-AMP-43]|uniref:ribose-phosphate diphosphokinase n=1 Tax=Salinisphaera sp. SPP-AMP-43 TaxID=3121288 RepID=UPI003C6DEACD